MDAVMNDALNGFARKSPIAAAIVVIIRAVIISICLLFMALSVPVAILTPIIPVGIPLGLLGLFMVAAASKTAHRIITNRLRRFPWIWKHVRKSFGEKDGEPAE